MIHANSTKAEVVAELQLCDERLTDLSNASHWAQGLTDYEWGRQYHNWRDRQETALRIGAVWGLTLEEGGGK